MKKEYLTYFRMLAIILFVSSCQEQEYSLPEANTHFQNDVIKRSIGPNVVGLNIEFVYAMALGLENGNILSAQVEASIPGAAGTFLEHRSYYTGPGGNDVGIDVANPSTTSGPVTEVVFTRDTCAAALRYYYIIPEEARGKSVSFTFSAEASTGETVSFKMGPYNIGKVEIKRDITLNDNDLRYFSIADMQVYDSTDAAAIPDKIDLVYLYRSISGINFNHALVAPGADPEFLPDIILPGGVNNPTKIRQTWQLRDEHLARLQYHIYIDDLDFEEIDLSSSSDYAINLRAESGAWVETADGNYRAFVYVNSVSNSGKTMKISVKRYTMN